MMRIYQKDSDNPVFIIRLVDQFGVSVAGVTSPTVTLSKSQGADGTTVTWVEDTDFTWHELTDNERLKGVYKLRQKDSPNVSAVDTVGQCALDVYKTDAATAHGVAVYQVNTHSWDELLADFTVSGSTGEALSLATIPVNVILGAIQTTLIGGNRTSSPVALEMFQNEAKTFALTVLDADGDPVDLSLMTLRFLVENAAAPPVAKFKVEAPNIAVSGDDDEIALVTVSSTLSATASDNWHWRLWDTIGETVLLHGSFEIKAAQDDT